MRVERISLSEWEDGLPSTGFEPFHTAPALDVLDEHVAGETHLLGGFKGDHLVAMLPVFVQRRSVGRALTSPPPGMGVPRLGPLVMPNSPKRRKQERVNRRFVEGALDELDADSRLTVLRFIGSSDYADPRPFRWSGYEVTPSFTYRVDLTDTTVEEIRRSFSKDLRQDVTQAEDAGVTVELGGVEGAREVFEDSKQRYAEQDKEFSLTWPYVRDLVEAMGDRCRVYVVRSPEDEFLNGLITLYSNDAAYSWIGGTAADYEGISVNGFLQWTIIEDAMAGEPFDSLDAYDLAGANTERLCRFKATFGGDLVPYYVVESEGQTMDVAKRAYQMVSR